MMGYMIPPPKTIRHICHVSALLLNAKAQRPESLAKETDACCIFFATLRALGIFAFNFRQKVFVDGMIPRMMRPMMRPMTRPMMF